MWNKKDEEDREKHYKEQDEKAKEAKKKLAAQVLLKGKDAEKAAKDDMKEQSEKLSKEAEEKRKEEYYSKLAKPKDKWKVGRKLLELQKAFPHDRVLERMVAEEFKSNQPFRAPEEYDVYSKALEDPKKGLSKKMKAKAEKFDRMGNPVKDSFGGQKLAEFKQQDVEEVKNLAREKTTRRREIQEFEDELIAHARAYHTDVIAKRASLEGETKTTRLYVAEVYQNMRNKFTKLMDQKFPLCKDGQKEDSHTLAVAFPQKFGH